MHVPHQIPRARPKGARLYANWLFAGSLRAGKRAAAIMSLVHGEGARTAAERVEAPAPSGIRIKPLRHLVSIRVRAESRARYEVMRFPSWNAFHVRKCNVR